MTTLEKLEKLRETIKENEAKSGIIKIKKSASLYGFIVAIVFCGSIMLLSLVINTIWIIPIGVALLIYAFWFSQEVGKMGITLNYDLIKKKAKGRGCSPASLIKKEVINYRETRGVRNCLNCELCIWPIFKGEKLVMCSLVGIDVNDKDCIVDEFHICNGHNIAHERVNIKEQE